MATPPDDSRDRFDPTRQAFWKDVLQRLAPRIRAYVAKTRCSDDEVEEITFDVIAELVEREATFVLSDDLWRFTLPILRNCCSVAVRRWRREAHGGGDSLDLLESKPPEEREDYNSHLRIWFREALAALSPQERLAIGHHILHNRGYHDIAAAMETSEGNVRRHVSGGLKRLRERGSPPPDTEKE
jgi:RNA polymerase sigma factor (sigma-70 family)